MHVRIHRIDYIITAAQKSVEQRITRMKGAGGIRHGAFSVLLIPPIEIESENIRYSEIFHKIRTIMENNTLGNGIDVQ